ncbi:MAG TPA: hypothetical protein PKN13_11315 [Accumulibacter sp.]|nr:hypothetical protein [Accumulibacter sp.]HMW18094.1 hypothetical protein [Accumulibacter sp.]HNC17190.1 hypothetical protein [Accumulibacter sp.]HND81205.1 hypothetical protein [Accumulibacter sp.]HNG38768.1 hypothetical protein [Accumulibacter sp.]
MSTLANVLRLCGVAGGVVGWAALAHQASSQRSGSDLTVLVAVIPALVILPLLWRFLKPAWVLAAVVVVAGLLAHFWPALRDNVALLYYWQHLGIHLALGVLFGRSLFGNADSLVTHMARLAHHGVLSTEQLRYTRLVTLAWTAYFFTIAGVSTALYLLAPAASWSFFANVLGMPLLFLMCAAEFVVRQFALPPADRTSMADTVRAYRTAVRDGRLFANRR